MIRKNPKVAEHHRYRSQNWSRQPDKMPQYPKKIRNQGKNTKKSISEKENWLKKAETSPAYPKRNRAAYK